eukprot:14827344-Alexandrium_andersonii.AAC.1
MTHLLRAAAPAVRAENRRAVDGLLARTLQRALGGGLEDVALDQASSAVADGGLGLRRASRLSLIHI